MFKDCSEIDTLIQEFDELFLEIEEFNSVTLEDTFSRGDILEARRVALISKGKRLLGEENVISLFS
jgi:hypothetical protein